MEKDQAGVFLGGRKGGVRGRFLVSNRSNPAHSKMPVASLFYSPKRDITTTNPATPSNFLKLPNLTIKQNISQPRPGKYLYLFIFFVTGVTNFVRLSEAFI
jgi:hypothetical protein